MNNKIVIESLSMDLMRVALGYQRGSERMAKRFADEALKRIGEIDMGEIKPYFLKSLGRISKLLVSADKEKISEDSLMYSTICRNYSKHYC